MGASSKLPFDEDARVAILLRPSERGGAASPFTSTNRSLLRPTRIRYDSIQEGGLWRESEAFLRRLGVEAGARSLKTQQQAFKCRDLESRRRVRATGARTGERKTSSCLRTRPLSNTSSS